MAQKKITDLTLRSSFDATCNIPVDDTSQTWRTTGQQVLDYIKAAAQTPIPTVQTFTSGSGTYTKPAGVKWIKVRMAGGGGGGGGGNNSTAAASGGNTTFGTSLLTASGGVGGKASNTYVATGGSCTINSPAREVFSVNGGDGAGKFYTNAGLYLPGGPGGSNPLGGAGCADVPTGVGGDARSNTGGGGAGGGTDPVTAIYSGGGGAAGGYLEAIIDSPSATYAYAVGAGGSGTGGGTSGWPSGAGGSGIIIVEEHYI